MLLVLLPLQLLLQLQRCCDVTDTLQQPAGVCDLHARLNDSRQRGERNGQNHLATGQISLALNAKRQKPHARKTRQNIQDTCDKITVGTTRLPQNGLQQKNTTTKCIAIKTQQQTQRQKYL